MCDGAREVPILQQIAQHMRAGDPQTHVTPVHLQPGQGAKHAHPLDVVEWTQLLAMRGLDQTGGANIDDACGHVRLLQIGADTQHLERDIARHAGVDRAPHRQALVHHAGQEIGAIAPAQHALAAALNEQVEVVDLLPGLAWHGVACGAQDFAGAMQRGDHRSRVFVVEQQEAHHVGFLGVVVQPPEVLLSTDNVHQRIPAELDLLRQVEHQLGVDVDQSRRAFGALQIATEPVDVVSDPREH